MTELQQFINLHKSEIEGPETVPDLFAVRGMLAPLDFANARELERYLATYGWLGYKSVEFYGMGDGFSDMSDETVKLRAAWPITNGYAALEGLGGGAWALCDGHGRVFRFDVDTRSLTDLHMQLEAYILDRLREEEGRA